MWLPHSFPVLVFALLANGSLTNTTIDDSNSSFSFDGSSGAWNTITPSSPCTICSSTPDHSKVYHGTWHDGNIRNGAPSGTAGSFTFQGSAVYIFGIDQAESQPDIVFTLDSIQQVHRYTGSEQFVYDALFFSATGLASDQTHTVNWVFNIANTGVMVQAALFDYAVVTTGSDATTAGSRDTTTTSAGAAAKPTSNSAQSTSGKPASSTHSSTSPTGSQTFSSDPNSSGASQDQPSSPTVTVSNGITATVTAQSAVNATTRSKSNLGAIIGGIAGALVVAVLLVLFLYLRSRRRRRPTGIPEGDKVARSQFLRIEDYPLHSLQTSLPTTDTQQGGHASSKRQYLNDDPGPSTASLLLPETRSNPSDSHGSQPHPEVAIEPPAVQSGRTTSRDFRFLEERLATLEAQVAVQQQPPPYIHDDDN
ncbi:hypothetical protein C8F04DRAFT_1387605 [Mycena alexandri]|uniref:Uncharacterized protein n=1 Tax=Mycena alexandri TaxID=1745969 RepID=A0AAD6XGF0_9AGAR|nr:hypothetical protein C8F04DRAFT_1387605 [Mycena alexandri]